MFNKTPRERKRSQRLSHPISPSDRIPVGAQWHSLVRDERASRSLHPSGRQLRVGLRCYYSPARQRRAKV